MHILVTLSANGRGGNRVTSFGDRRDAFEKRFAHDEELRFKATARRNKLLGLWAADKIGMTDEEANAYAKSVVLADFEEAGDADVLQKVAGDLKAAGINLSDSEIRRVMDELMVQAVKEIQSQRRDEAER
jgi:hypothetical protein